jgi:hypothetical protein
MLLDFELRASCFVLRGLILATLPDSDGNGSKVQKTKHKVRSSKQENPALNNAGLL